MKRVFLLLDSDKDGELTSKDLNLIAERCIKVGHLKGDEAADIKKKCAWVYGQYMNADGGPTTFNEMLTNMKKAGKEHLSKTCKMFFPLFFAMIDTDQDGFISHKEYAVFGSLLAVNEVDAKKAFEKIDLDKDGKISKEEFFEAGDKFCVLEKEGDSSQHLLGPLA